MDRSNIVGGSHSGEKCELARQMRQSMPPAEARLWRELRARRLDGLHFRRQQVIDGYIVDFYCHTLGLVIEVDGDVHDRQAGYDEYRTRVIGVRGLTVLRFSNEEVLRTTQVVLEAIRRAVAELRPTPQPPS